MIQLLLLFFFFGLFTLFHPADVYAGAILDQAPPACSIIYSPNSSPQISGTVVNITVSADDSQTGDSGILAINLYQPSTTLIATTTSSPLSYTWNTATAGSYTFSATATDGVGDPNSCFNPITTFVISSIPIYSPWIQTTSGDVHSNTRINIPGGP